MPASRTSARRARPGALGPFIPALSALLFIALAILIAAFAPSCKSPRETGLRTVESGDLAIELAPNGGIAGVVFKRDGLRRAITGGTRLEGCSPLSPTVIGRGSNGAWEFETRLGDAADNTCRLIERFSPHGRGIRWEIEITGLGGPWTTAIRTWLKEPEPAKARFWSPWGDPRQGAQQKLERAEVEARGIAPAAPVGDWTDPLIPMPFTDALLWFGAPAFAYEDPILAYIPFQPDLFCIPLATILIDGPDLGLSLALSPADPHLELTLATGADGSVVFSRSNHRVGRETPLRFTADLVPHEADWRGGLRWMTTAHPEYFDPSLPLADELAGTGAYSAYEGPLDAARFRRMAFRTNWKASWDFPYMGMFLPPLPTGDSWTRFGGGLTSIPKIREYIRGMRSLGFYVLNYFNVTEFGTEIVWPPPSLPAQPEPEWWRDPNRFLYGKLAEAILLVPPRTKLVNQRAYHQTKVDGPYYTWKGGIILDPGEPVYRDFLLAQARRHVDEIPESSGICIDRMDWLRMNNERRDDGVSWFEGLPVRSLYNSWRDLMGRLGPLMHNAGKVVFLNNHTKRIDLSRDSDGYFDEFTYRGVPLNLTGLMALRRPALGWTESPDEIRPDPDAFFQRFLYMGVYPMAPFPMNDHSLEPHPEVDPHYLDYGPLLDAMRGKKWVLAPHAVTVDGGAAKANAFEVPGGYVIPVVYGGKGGSVRLRLGGLDGIGALNACTALHPGAGDPVRLGIVIEAGRAALDVPLVRGCAMVRIAK